MNEFNLDKMTTELVGEGTSRLAHYRLGETHLNPLVGKPLKLIFKKQINCTHCGNTVKKAYAGGYCYPCSIKLAECDMCILKPELCHYSKGTCREPSWGGKQLHDPSLYLSRELERTQSRHYERNSHPLD